MKTRFKVLAAVCAFSSILGSAQASLVFDQVLVGQYFGETLSTDQSLPLTPVTVVAGSSDEVDIHTYAHVNVDPASIHVRFNPPSQQKWGDVGIFNGLKITALDWIDAKELRRFSVTTNMIEELCNVCQPYTDRLIIGDNFVAFDWRGYLFTADSYFDVQVGVVPEPGTLALLTLGLAGLGCSRRKQRTLTAG
jgi:hypothetical protein